MAVLISMLRGVNLGPHNRIKMDELRALYESLKFEDPRSYVQSGNIIFRTREKNGPQLVKKIKNAIEKKFGCSPDIILRTTEEIRKSIAANPFPERTKAEPGKVLVTFLAAEPPRDARVNLEKFKQLPEELHLKGRELYIYFPNGAGRSKLPWSAVEKLLNVTGTARNWNSVQAILAIAEEMENI
ncbi:MAG TPA: DUF1697 domain-containing protein [Candidatus Sulfotelmatobacter sp.]|nr:DUF1697 domain-containing protein [Candidatus Sulfotelmatobacter sp.]